MSKKLKHQSFELNFAVISRLSIFLVTIYFLITLFSSSANSPPVLNGTSNKPISAILNGEVDPIDYFNNTITPTLQSGISTVTTFFEGFPGRQLSDLRKMLIRQAADELIKSTEN